MGLFDFFGFNPTSPTKYAPDNEGFGGGGGESQSGGFNFGAGLANLFGGGNRGGMNADFSGGNSNPFPVDSFRNDSFSSMLSQFPQSQGFMELLSQQPRREDFKPSLGRKIGAGLAGIASSFGNPNSGGDVAFNILNRPFQRANEDYQMRLNNARQGAGLEQGLAGLFRQFGNDEFQRNQAGQELGLKRDQLTQQGALGNREIDVKQKALENQAAQQQLDRALQERRISIDQYQAATQRLNAETNQKEAASRDAYYKGMLANKQNPQPKPPNSAMINQRLDSMIRTDSVLSPYLTQNGKLDFEKVREDPMATMKLKSIYQQLGLMPSPDIELR